MWTRKLSHKATPQLFKRLVNVGRGPTSLMHAEKIALWKAAEQLVNIVENMLDPVGVSYDELDELHSTYDGGTKVLDSIIENDFGQITSQMLFNLNWMAPVCDSLPELFLAPFLLLCHDFRPSYVRMDSLSYNPKWRRGYGDHRPGVVQLGSQVWIMNRRVDFVIRYDQVEPGSGPNLLFIEIDSLKWHMNRRSMVEDRRRDREHLRAGIPTLRFMASEIFHDPKACTSEIEAVYSKFIWPE